MIRWPLVRRTVLLYSHLAVSIRWLLFFLLPCLAASSRCAACQVCHSTRYRRRSRGHRWPRRRRRRRRDRRSRPPAAGPCPKCPQAGDQHYIYSNERRRKADTPSESTRARRMLKDCHRGLGCFGAELRTFWAGLLVPNIMFEYTPPHRAREREKKARAERHPRIKQRVPR